jgi:hypothetical protein
VNPEPINENPVIFPDYIGVTIPSNIAPLNFNVLVKNVSLIDAAFIGSNGYRFNVQADKKIIIPKKKWHKLLRQSAGECFEVLVSVKNEGEWYQYQKFKVFVKDDSIDYGLAYRLIAPGYEVYSKMGIYQRELSTYRQQTIVENTLFTGSCMNCHSFRETNAEDMTFHIRGAQGGTVLKTKQQFEMLDTKTKETLSKCVYPYWHPSGKYIAYSLNKTQQTFHASSDKKVEVFDHASDIVVYDIENNELITCEPLNSDENFETFPAFSPDGNMLYFCSSEAGKMPGEFMDIKYNLLSIPFDPDAGRFGFQVDTLVNASAIGKSISFPRPSYNGRFIMYTLSDYGNFSIWHKEADLWMLNLDERTTWPLSKLNSENTESYHSWSSDSRWVVFSSRRVNGLYTMPYIAHIDEKGKGAKPFLLPQSDPDYYSASFFSFNIPEFINKAIDVDNRILEYKVKNDNKQVSFKLKE